ncbi:hypothetical protein [Agrobacterium rosae]
MSNLLSIETLENDRKFVETQRLKASSDRWGTTKIMWDERLAEIDEKINHLKESIPSRASVALIFDGIPVIGRGDIRLDFSTDALSSYQRIISAALASQTELHVGSKGKVKGEARSKLYIRDIVRGSMGFILEELEPPQNDMFNTPLKNAVEEVTRLIERLGHGSKDDFDVVLNDTAPRLIGALQKFTKVLRDAGATTKIVGDEAQVALGLEDISRLNERFDDISVDEETQYFFGLFQGVLPFSREFELELLENQGTLTGTASDDLIEKYLNDQQFRENLLLKPVTAQVKFTRSFRRKTLIKQQVTLENVEPRVEHPDFGRF